MLLGQVTTKQRLHMQWLLHSRWQHHGTHHVLWGHEAKPLQSPIDCLGAVLTNTFTVKHRKGMEGCKKVYCHAAAGFGAKAQDAQVLMQVLKLMIFACNRFSSKHLKHVVQNLRHSYTLCQHGNSMVSARVLQARNQSQSKLPLLPMWGTSTCWPKGCKANLCITRKIPKRQPCPGTNSSSFSHALIAELNVMISVAIRLTCVDIKQ